MNTWYSFKLFSEEKEKKKKERKINNSYELDTTSLSGRRGRVQ